MALVIGLQHCPTDMVIQGVKVTWIWRPLVFGNEIWVVGSEPDLSSTSCVLLENVSTGQQLSAVIDKTGKQTANIVCRIHCTTLVNKVESFLVNKTHASWDHHMLRKILTFSQKMGWDDISFLAACQECCSGCWQEGLNKKIFLLGEENTFCVNNSESTNRVVACSSRFSCTGFRTKFLTALQSLSGNNVKLITLKYCKLIIWWYDC